MSYIEREVAKNLILNDMAKAEREGKDLNGYTDAMFHLKTIPDADVAEVRHGHWIHSVKVLDEKHSYHRFRCSLCGRVTARPFETDVEDLLYCHCGAKMGGERRETEQEEIWEKNLELLKSGGFGSMNGKECFVTLLRYWKAQEQAGYPKASENVKYFEEIVRRRDENEG